ncbi:diguanylate cyclase (GGDEF)-like protein [Clostridium acetobutylicum]|nr:MULTISPECIES: GGDEF domain-containing protein [Clostridium]ADZ20620.1 Diguanylate cyclase/phosphodiesterase domain 1 (GGDEF) [Clostridium acetobutylicum EA 2018]NOV90394.1 diguanylate cyclase (GGDEF)-like protein [Clostridium acetobutylicum]NOW15080.1 diguanylate cyclase (GGDEF)-like protein [Clostridium acetobutylicum]NRY56760.1 diguanylate cyclase (GGDEF)-like protein [Clostridium acetobutylicum]NSA93505.1 diguanylate cyclase (GGDEF)-like protein [Clostridium acetobutylicum]
MYLIYGYNEIYEGEFIKKGQMNTMVELRKLIVFLLSFTFLLYLLYVGINISKKLRIRRSPFFLMISGVGLITLGTFLDAIDKFIDVGIKNVIAACFTFGAILFVVFIIFLSNNFVCTVSLLYEDANMDKMTGAYNRKGINEIFQRSIAKQNSFYLMLFDLDETKRLNDKYGHAVGDKYIIGASAIIKDTIGNKGFVGRIGGDEFIALLKLENEVDVEKIKKLIKDQFCESFKQYGANISIGYSRFKEDGQEFEEIFQIADKNMYDDKKSNKKNKACF